MNTIKTLILLIAMITTAISADAEGTGVMKKKKRPEGRPIYCSYSVTRPAGQGKDFCEFLRVRSRQRRQHHGGGMP